MDIHIPVWLLWALGIPLGIIALVCIIVGAMFIVFAMRGGDWRY